MTHGKPQTQRKENKSIKGDCESDNPALSRRDFHFIRRLSRDGLKIGLPVMR